MVWQVLAMWAIVIVTITWFVRDERRLRREAALVQAAAYYAHRRVPAYSDGRSGGDRCAGGARRRADRSAAQGAAWHAEVAVLF